MDGVGRLRHLAVRVRWEARRVAGSWLRHLGWGGAAGALLLVLAALCAVLSASTAVRERSLNEEVGALPVVASVRQPGALDHQVRLDAFQSYLLPARDVPGSVERLLALAADKGLVLKTGEYRLEAERGATFAGYRITLPVVGPAAAIQDFLLSALRQHKTLALESVNFKRQRIESAALEARVQFVLLTRLAAASGANP